MHRRTQADLLPTQITTFLSLLPASKNVEGRSLSVLDTKRRCGTGAGVHSNTEMKFKLMLVLHTINFYNNCNCFIQMNAFKWNIPAEKY